MKPKSIDQWRNYFQGVNSSIFEIIEHAITVAAIDHPMELKLQREQIAEKLYLCHRTHCCGHDDQNELKIPQKTNNEILNVEFSSGRVKNKFNGNASDLKVGRGKQIKVDSCRDDHAEMNMTQVSKYSYSEAEALTDEIDEEKETIGEVLRIKEILYNRRDKSETVLFESLRRLQLMVLSVEILQSLRRLQLVVLSVEILQATEIGKAVNALQEHRSKQIRQFARGLVNGWKIMVKEWCDSTAAIAGSTDSNPSAVFDEEGLPSPPLDEGALFATHAPIELSQFFDGIDDDGNPENSMEFDKNHESRRKPQPENQKNTKQKSHLLKEATMTINDKKRQLIKQESVNELTKSNYTQPSNTESWPKLSLEQKVNNGIGFQNNPYKNTIHRRPSTGEQDKYKRLDEAAVLAKLEGTKRKLQECYQQAENARKKRTTQFMDLHELPKQSIDHRSPYLKGKNHYRSWANGR